VACVAFVAGLNNIVLSSRGIGLLFPLTNDHMLKFGGPGRNREGTLVGTLEGTSSWCPDYTKHIGEGGPGVQV
jgi:hypothetical protein